MLKWIFGRRAAPVVVDVNEVFRRLELNSKHFKDDPAAHIPVLDYLRLWTLRGSSHYGPARSFYANPNQKITIKAPEPQFSDMPREPDEHIRSSACVSFTEESYARGKRGLAILIRQSSNTMEGYANSVVFGMYGVYDRDGKMTVKKLMVPTKDNANRMMPVESIDVTEDSVRGALLYAELCVKELVAGRPLFARSCLDQSVKADLAKDGVKILTPAP